MNCEQEVKKILNNGLSVKKRVEMITSFTNFQEEDIMTALKKGGRNVSEIYKNLINLDKR